MELWCSFCGRHGTAELNESFDFMFQNGCDCDMTDWRLRRIDSDEQQQIAGVLARVQSAFAAVPAGGVLIQARVGAPDVDSALLDTALLLFNHVVLCVDGVDFETSGLGDRVECYVDAGYVTPIIWDTRGSRGFHHGLDDFYDPFAVHHLPQSVARRSVNLPRLADEQLGMPRIGIRLVTEQLAWLDHFQVWDAIPRGDFRQLVRETENGLYSPELDFKLMSLCGEQLIAGLLSASSMPRQELGVLARSLSVQQQVESELALLSVKGQLADWYVRTSGPFPRFENPRTVLALKEAVGGESLQGTVDRLLQESSGRLVTYGDLLDETEQALDRLLTKSRYLSRRGVRFTEIGSAAITGTVGGLLGGPFGAVIGGIGGALVPLSVELLKGRGVAWTSYFA